MSGFIILWNCYTLLFNMNPGEKLSRKVKYYEEQNRYTDKNQQIDKILQEQYDAETKILESALLNVAGKTSWDEFPEESEEKIRRGMIG